MRILAASALVIALLGMSTPPLFANEAVVAEKVGSSYTLAMEGMT